MDFEKNRNEQFESEQDVQHAEVTQETAAHAENPQNAMSDAQQPEDNAFRMCGMEEEADAAARYASHTASASEAEDAAPQEPQPAHTPYETPVREGRPEVSAQAGQNRSTYDEWMQQQAQYEKKHARKPRRPRSKKPLMIAGVVVAACVLFGGGLAIGGMMHQTPSVDQAVEDTELNREDLPTVQISSKPEGGSTSSTNGALSGEEIYAKVSPSVVTVQAVDLEAMSSGSGSGVIMSEDGYIITNNHVVVNEDTGEEVDKVTVILSDGTSIPAEIVGRDEQTDLAVLKVTADAALTPAEFGNSDELSPGELCYAIGSPGGVELANTITSGNISAINRDITIDDRVMTLIQTSASINPGNSGGALINQYGQVVGITSAKLGISYYESLGFAIPINSAKEIVDELIQYGYIAGRPQIGISGSNLSEEAARAYNLPQGVWVRQVDSRSNAAAAGIQVNDIIIGVNGQTITEMDEINEVKDSMSAGDTITLEIYRMSTGKTQQVTFALNDQHDLEGDDPAVVQQQQEQQQQNQQQYSDPFSYFFGW